MLIVAMIATAAGCSVLDNEMTGPSMARPSPAWRILNPSMTRRQTGSGILTVSRQTNPSWTCLHRVFVDEEAVADLRSNEFVTIYLPVGHHVLSVQGTLTSCPGSSVLPVDVVGGVNQEFISKEGTASAFELHRVGRPP